MENTNKNIAWIDTAKFIGIFLVILTHTIGNLGLLKTGIFELINNFCNLFYMPLFFVLAGYLYKQKNRSQNYNKILWSLLIPYLIYQFLYLPFVIGNKVLYHHLPIFDVTKKCLIGILLGDVISDVDWYQGVCFPCWFIMVIMQLRLLFANINITTQKLIGLSLLSIIIIKILTVNHIDLFGCLDNTLMAIPYFSLGYLLKNKFKLENYIETFSKFKTCIYIAPLVIILLLILKFNGFIIYARVTYNIQANQSLLLIFLAGIVGSLMVILFSSLFSTSSSFIKTIGKNTLFIIYFHFQLIFFMSWMRFKTYIYSANKASFLFFVLFLSLVNLVICYFAIKFLKRYCPIVLGKGLTK